jgi:hypothetical protein
MPRPRDGYAGSRQAVGTIAKPRCAVKAQWIRSFRDEDSMSAPRGQASGFA